jgi:PrtD family type I secretion system ABC transporter
MLQRTISHQIAEALHSFRRFFMAVFLISGVVNILALTGSFYMLQVYDRVLGSRSIPTLVALSALAIGLYLFQGVLDVLRSQILVRLGSRLDQTLMPIAHEAALALPLGGVSTTDAQQPIRDVDAMRAFLAGQGLIALFDIPWMPVYIAFIFMLSSWLGLLALGGMFLLVVLTWLNERLTNHLSKMSMQSAATRIRIADANVRNAEVLRAMGIGPRAASRFERANAEHLAIQARASDIAGTVSGLSKILRMILQSAMLGLGAYLTIRGDVTAGAIIACSIASARATAPLELAITNWRGFVAARQGRQRLAATLASLPTANAPLAMPPPSKTLALEGITLTIPGTQRVVLMGVSFELKAGQALGVIGPSAAGKSSLARAITGVWPLAKGTVRLDGATLDRWSVPDLGRSFGYLPQDVELFDGTISDNIGRFEDQPDSRAILAAAHAADVHEMILRLPDGYETRLGQGGAALSAGQRQRIALARALYGAPFLVVLDEPNSNLDGDGEAALGSAIQSVRARGGIAIIVSHRPSALGAVDMVAVIGNGQLTAFGPKDEVLRKVLRPTAVNAS